MLAEGDAAEGTDRRQVASRALGGGGSRLGQCFSSQPVLPGLAFCLQMGLSVQPL